MSTVEKLLARMIASKKGWGQRELHTLYTGFGFVVREGRNHRFYSHPTYPELFASVARHNDLAIGYTTTAIKLIQQLKEKEASE